MRRGPGPTGVGHSPGRLATGTRRPGLRWMLAAAGRRLHRGAATPAARGRKPSRGFTVVQRAPAVNSQGDREGWAGLRSRRTHLESREASSAADAGPGPAGETGSGRVGPARGRARKCPQGPKARALLRPLRVLPAPVWGLAVLEAPVLGWIPDVLVRSQLGGCLCNNFSLCNENGVMKSNFDSKIVPEPLDRDAYHRYQHLAVILCGSH